MRGILTWTVLALMVVLVILPTAMGRLLNRPSPQPVRDGSDRLPVKVYFPTTREVKEIPLGEYLKGVVAAEMPAEFGTEALKAQFVVARTYTVGRMQQFVGPGRGGCQIVPQADVCADHNTNQAYMTREEVIGKYGAYVGANLWKRLDQAQAETVGLVLTYRGALIDPLYHSVSGTVTEDAGEYFVKALPYLRSVDDRWGAYAPKLLETRSFTPETLAAALSMDGRAIPAAGMAASLRGGEAPVQVLSRTAAGRVKSVRVGDAVLTGREIRERMDLRSTDFTVSLRDGQVFIETRGYGHGVGMSQYGANGMAEAGKSYREILLHYYTGVDISRMFEG